MNKLQTIITEVAAGVRTQMENYILAGAKGMHFEQVYGNAYVDIEYYSPSVVTVIVSHVDTSHSSPLLEGEIMKALPEWSEVYNEIFWEDKQTA
jgi:hypothetical protein